MWKTPLFAAAVLTVAVMANPAFTQERAPAPRAKAQPAGPAVQWEYKVLGAGDLLDLAGPPRRRMFKDDPRAEALNKLGEDGWELAGVESAVTGFGGFGGFQPGGFGGFPAANPGGLGGFQPLGGAMTVTTYYLKRPKR